MHAPVLPAGAGRGPAAIQQMVLTGSQQWAISPTELLWQCQNLAARQAGKLRQEAKLFAKGI